ncbi:MAG: hypothetical protein AAF412_06960 [Pseudomonadota bacterium]
MGTELIPQFEKWANRADGVLDSEFSTFRNHIMVCEFDPSPLKAPSILVAGKDSSQAQLLGLDWIRALPEKQTTPDDDWEEASARSYVEAAENGYSCHECEYLLDLGNGQQLVRFMRYIRPLRTETNINLFAVAGELQPLVLQ